MNVLIAVLSAVALAFIGALTALLVEDAWKAAKKVGRRNWLAERKWQILGFAIVTATVLSFVTLYQAYIERANKALQTQSTFSRSPSPAAGWRHLGFIIHANIEWRVRAPHIVQGRVTQFPEPLDCATTEVSIPALCPKCAVELRESASILSGFSWQCPKCFATIHSDVPMVEAAQGAREAAIRECESGKYYDK